MNYQINYKQWVSYMQEKKRIFIAIDIPHDVKKELTRVQNAVRELELCKANYVGVEQLHITMKFIGDMAFNDIKALREQLRGIRLSITQARLGHLDFFGSKDHIKILFAHCVCPPLSELAQEIDVRYAIAQGTTMEEESRPFVPHITLARIKQVYDRDALLYAINTYEVEPIEFEITEFQLYESVLHQEGPEHTVLETYLLNM